MPCILIAIVFRARLLLAFTRLRITKLYLHVRCALCLYTNWYNIIMMSSVVPQSFFFDLVPAGNLCMCINFATVKSVPKRL